MKDELIIAGEYIFEYNQILNINLPCGDIYQSTGLSVHIKKRHPNCLKYLEKVPDIILSPDYIGKNPNEYQSVEFVKQYDDNILVAVKLDIIENRLYVASLYDISESKIKNRLNSGRFKKWK